MKKLFTIDDIMVAFVSALGYGYGETLSRLFGWPDVICIVASFALGLVLEEIISMIAFSKTVQKKPINRVITYVSIVLIFVICHQISVTWMGTSMISYLKDEFVSVVGFPIVGFVVNLLIRAYRIRKIRSVYGDGSKGFVFNVTQEDRETLNQANQPIHGEFDASLAVKTRTGTFVGENRGKTTVYLGIPYAMPPVGDLRWKAPRPLPSSQSVFEARHFGASAIQVEHKGSLIRYHRQSEDCLTLNICVSTQESEAPRPVVVLFHPGDFTCGGSANPLLSGEDLVTNHPEILFVSFNFRLGILGFIDFSEIPGGQDYPDAINLGLLDQIAALKWIRENIPAFGGDPDRITLLGFESGAVCIQLLASCRQAKGLFQRALALNGGPVFVHDKPQPARSLAENLLRVTGTSSMKELVQLDTNVLKDAAQKLWESACAPTCDGVLVPDNVYLAMQNGVATDIDFVIGIPCNEMQVFRSMLGNHNYREAVFGAFAELESCLDDSASGTVRAYLEKQMASSDELEAKSKLAEQWLGLSLYHCADCLAKGGSRVHLLYWNEVALIEKLGSGSVDLAAAFLGTGDALEMYGNIMDADLSETLQSLLAKFIEGEALKFYPNEIRGIDAFSWKAFPKALIVSDGKLQCDRIEDRLTEIPELHHFVVSLEH